MPEHNDMRRRAEIATELMKDAKVGYQLLGYNLAQDVLTLLDGLEGYKEALVDEKEERQMAEAWLRDAPNPWQEVVEELTKYLEAEKKKQRDGPYPEGLRDGSSRALGTLNRLRFQCGIPDSEEVSDG